MMTTYSAFFSSGLLAPYHAHHVNGFPKTPNKDRSSTKELTGFHTPYSDNSPIRPSSPLPLPDDSDIEVDPRSDDDSDMVMDFDKRELTPTQHSVSAAAALLNPGLNPTSTATTSVASGLLAGRPRLRKRRSSLTVAASPMNSIRSPTRNAGAALQLQRHLALSPGNRSRSGSVTAPSSAVEGQGMFSCIGFGNVANEGTSLMGRLRSGSVGSNIAASGISAVPGRIRRHFRRTASGPAPAPPPTAPLPALPTFPPSDPSMTQRAASRTPLVFQNGDKFVTPSITLNGNTTKSAAMSRDRAFSVSSIVGRIEEEMKEN